MQPAQVKMMQRPIENVENFEAKKLSRASWKGRSWERVQFRQQYDPQSPVSAFDYNLIFWLAIDNARIVKVEELDDKDKNSQTHEVLEQTFNPVIPASTFVLKIPKGAKKE